MKEKNFYIDNANSIKDSLNKCKLIQYEGYNELAIKKHQDIELLVDKFVNLVYGYDKNAPFNKTISKLSDIKFNIFNFYDTKERDKDIDNVIEYIDIFISYLNQDIL